jgi:3-oxoacyl-[acyl-carrier protein] reductase
MEKKSILVTGATSGIGEAVARHLAAAGHAVVLTGRNRAKLEEMTRALQGKGLRAAAVPGDLTREEEARAVVAEALKASGTLHVLVHSAGIFSLSPVEETAAGELQRVLETNLVSLQRVLGHLLPHFYEKGFGHVVAISSIAGREAFPGQTAYCSSKWGLMGYLGALRMEARERGVRVTAIMPGPVLTPEWDTYGGTLHREKMLAAGDVAGAVAFAIGQGENACVEELLLMPSRNPFGGRGNDM